ncbi:unnamed protein product [Owenia fusiformis]|uniref:Cytochrome P450 n=1 Tax=Owenia fusiformis TaxID=6347 RepID=A0A8S4PWZ0_OWEFU|nr:unnamed protein product [Owenia fusiformis]
MSVAVSVLGLSIICNNLMTVLVFVATFLLTWWYTQPENVTKLPPGPFPWPIFGNIFSLAPTEEDNSGAQRLWEMTRYYGSDIISVKFGAKRAIVVHKYSDIKRISDEFVHVNKEGANSLFLPGIIGVDGLRWKEQRRFALSFLRDFGFGKSRAQDIAQTEIKAAIAELDKSSGHPYNPEVLLKNMVSNVIAALVFGHRFEYNDKSYVKYLNMEEEILECFRFVIYGYLVPAFIRDRLPRDMFRIKEFKQKHAEMEEAIFRNEVRDHMANYTAGACNDYIDYFIKTMKEHEGVEKEHWFNERQLVDNIVDFFRAGTDTSAATLRWVFLRMATNPEIQKRVKEEIMETIGADQPPSIQDKPKMPFTETTIIECMRFHPILPLIQTRHTPDEPVKFKDFVLPPRTLIVENIHALHHDPDEWDEPDTFNPERFIGPNGKVIKDNHMLQFGSGKRECLGQPLAKMVIFLFLIGILQKFTIKISHGNEVEAMLKNRVGNIVNVPLSYDVVFTRD